MAQNLDGRFDIIERDTGEAIGIPTFFGLLDHPSEIKLDIDAYDRLVLWGQLMTSRARILVGGY